MEAAKLLRNHPSLLHDLNALLPQSQYHIECSTDCAVVELITVIGPSEARIQSVVGGEDVEVPSRVILQISQNFARWPQMRLRRAGMRFLT